MSIIFAAVGLKLTCGAILILTRTEQEGRGDGGAEMAQW